MKILTVSPYFESHRGGLELVAGRLAREFVRGGCEVTWLACDASPPPAAEAGLEAVAIAAVNLTERRLGTPFPIPSAAGARTIANAVRACDIVVAHDGLYPTTLIASRAAAQAGKPVMVIQHIGAIPYRNPALRGAMSLGNALVARPLLARAAQVVFISRTTAAYFASVRFKAPPATIFNGVDTDVFRPADDRTAARAVFGLPAERPLALFVGRFVGRKGLGILRRAAAERADITFAMAGWGHLDPAAWGLPNVAVFADLAGERLARIYQGADVLVLPSRGEGFPLVIQEALACGLPVVCGAETAAADPEAAPFLTGVDLTGGDEGEQARRVATAIDVVLAAGPPDREARRGFAAARYSWSAAGERYLGLIRGLVTETGG
ncbi:MAG TPA: glycosyltransferase family 4 protein [Caulobacteraceae bacterium]|nr:glycosyltransferase family 4 protein [Caulobacteraceae bacterium]